MIQTFVGGRFYISTAWRKGSTIVPNDYYYETLVWNWNPEKKEREELIETIDSGLTPIAALQNHSEICIRYFEKTTQD